MLQADQTKRITKPAPGIRDCPFPSHEEKAAWVKEYEVKKAANKEAASRPPVPPPSERRSVAMSAPEPRKLSVDEILHGRRPVLSAREARIDAILAGKALDPIEKDVELTAAQRAAWGRLDALMGASVVGDPLVAAVTAFAEALQGAD